MTACGNTSRTFSEGTRQCVGMNLAYAELYPTVVQVATFRFPSETDFSDLKIAPDLVNPFPTQDSKGISLLVN